MDEKYYLFVDEQLWSVKADKEMLRLLTDDVLSQLPAGRYFITDDGYKTVIGFVLEKN